jgi:hypothetical protein
MQIKLRQRACARPVARRQARATRGGSGATIGATPTMRRAAMTTCLRRAGALCLACLLLAACEDKRGPPKPITEQLAGAPAPVRAAPLPP